MEAIDNKRPTLSLVGYTNKEICEALSKVKTCVKRCPECCSWVCTSLYECHSKYGTFMCCDVCSHKCEDPDCDDEYGTRVFSGNEYRHEDCQAPQSEEENQQQAINEMWKESLLKNPPEWVRMEKKKPRC